jgi:2-polyprenyl-3-methyl-5-hydroxy-6-metoxy-1,4-benzoquinol methylase
MKEAMCRVCGSSSSVVVYDGPIRVGGVGSTTINGYKVRQCVDCDFVCLDPIPNNTGTFYQTNEYRNKFHNDLDIQGMQDRYDHEQNARVSRIGIEQLRNKIVADFGAGPGLFLDAISGVAKETIAIEPSKEYQEYHGTRNRKFISFGAEFLDEEKEIDVATSFDTIEHILDIKGFISAIFLCLRRNGKLFLSMPNHMDVVRLLFPESYESFFYQTSHINYFSNRSARVLLENAGFEILSIEYLHKYKVDNLFQWAKHGVPGQFPNGTCFDVHFNEHYRAEIERMGIASHLFIRARKKK